MSKIYDLDDVKQYIDKRAGIDISQKTRKRDVVYYKKIFCKIGQIMGFTLAYIGEKVNLTHDNVIYHCKTYDCVYSRHKIIFNELIEMYSLEGKFEIQKIKAKELEGNRKLDYVKNLLLGLDENKLEYFIEYRLKPYLKTIKNN